MIRLKPLLFVAPGLALAAGAILSAQNTTQTKSVPVPPQRVKIVPAPLSPGDLPPGRVKDLPAPKLMPSGSPFDLNAAPTAGRSIQVVSEAQMSEADRDLLANGESSIQERAGFENLDFNGRGWTYHELVCPALPNHLFLRFTRDKGTSEMSMFSAAIPRNGNGRVHIIPIVRKGYSLFSPAPIAALTMAAFNRIRAEEGVGASADWLGTGLCYAALAGANPHAAEPKPGTIQGGDKPDMIPPTLVVRTDGGAVIRFADASTVPPMQWEMTFDAKGKLVKASHAPAYGIRSKKVKSNTQDVVKAARSLPQQ